MKAIMYKAEVNGKIMNCLFRYVATDKEEIINAVIAEAKEKVNEPIWIEETDFAK